MTDPRVVTGWFFSRESDPPLGVTKPRYDTGTLQDTGHLLGGVYQIMQTGYDLTFFIKEEEGGDEKKIQHTMKPCIPAKNGTKYIRLLRHNRLYHSFYVRCVLFRCSMASMAIICTASI